MGRTKGQRAQAGNLMIKAIKARTMLLACFLHYTHHKMKFILNPVPFSKKAKLVGYF